MRAWVLLLALSGCPSTPTPAPTPAMTREQLLDPETCGTCHPTQFAQWSGSMHAYAADDPVFLAMNARGQRESNGALADFCVKCHAPMAVRDGLTKDGTNLATLPKKYKGVTCFFCHTIDAIEGSHDAALHLSGDLAMRGEYRDPVANTGHASTYSELHDRDEVKSAVMCGVCHDIVTSHGAPIERTYAEWQTSVFATLPGGSTCPQCHMDQSTSMLPIANTKNLPPRRLHSHEQVGVDLALTDFPNADLQKSKGSALLSTALQTALCVKTAGSKSSLRVIADNVAAGHSFPSGSGQDRRLWFDVAAYRGANPLYQDTTLVRDCIFDEQGTEVHDFWKAFSFESNALPAQVTFDALDPRFYKSHVFWQFPKANATFDGVPDRATLHVRLQPIASEVLDDLVMSGDLDPAIRAKMAVLDVGALLEWTPAKATAMYVEDNVTVQCVSATNLNVAADKFPAPERTKCSP